MAEIKSSRSNSLASPVRLPLLRSFFCVLVAALGSSSAGYALAYPSSALLDLAELPGDRVFKNIETLLFGVSYSFFGVVCIDVGVYGWYRESLFCSENNG